MEYTFERFKNDFKTEIIPEIFWKEEEWEEFKKNIRECEQKDESGKFIKLRGEKIYKKDISKLIKWDPIKILNNKFIEDFRLAIYKGHIYYHNPNYPLESDKKVNFPDIMGEDDHISFWLRYAIITNQFDYQIESDNKNSKELITYLAESNIAFKVIQLGGGVKKIVKMDNVCPMCQGTGLQHPERSVQYPHTYK